jgi:hypothetical protein
MAAEQADLHGRAVVAVALVAGSDVSTWQAVVATQAKGVAVHAQAKAANSEQRSRRMLYAADMGLAHTALKLNNLGRARRLLERWNSTGRSPARRISADGSGAISGN